MLYPDSPKRITEISKLSQFFQQKGFTKTANRISGFATILNGTSIPANFLAQVDALFDLFQKEFIDSVSVGKQYREQAFLEIKEIIVKALGRMFPDFNSASLAILPIVKKLEDGRNAIGDIADGLNQGTKDRKVKFHLCCYAYLIMVESVFDEIARILLFFSQVTPTNLPTAVQLEGKKPGDIKNELSSVPVFLANWKEKRHIRNAIAHSQTFFDSKTDQVRFVDDNNPADSYDRTMSFSDFMLIGLQFDDVVSSFDYVIALLGLIDIIGAKNLALP